MRFTMQMAMPEDEAVRPTFHFASTKTHANADPTGRPWAWTSTPAGPTDRPPVQVLCVLEADAGAAGYTAAGRFEAREVTLGFFEDEWALIADFDHVFIGGRPYDRSFELEPLALFEVTLRRVLVKARDL